MNIPPPISPGLPAQQAKKKGVSKFVLAVVVVVVLFIGFIGFRVVQFAIYAKNHPRVVPPGEAQFMEANRAIISNKGSSGYGNTPEATALAEQYSKSLKIMREQFFTKANADRMSLSKGEFLTWCQLGSTSCVFVVHVPDLRHFTRDAKDSLVDLAWLNAQSVLATRKGAPPKTIGVAVKGAALYERVTLGHFIADPEKDGNGIDKSGSTQSDTMWLYPFFAPTNAPASTP
jgi:hypothetical protein